MGLDADSKKNYSETPKESIEGFNYKFSCSRTNLDSKMDNSIENSIKNEKSSEYHLRAPPPHIIENSRGSKEDSKPALPIRPSSKRRMQKRISSRNRKNSKSNQMWRSMYSKTSPRAVPSSPKTRRHHPS